MELIIRGMHYSIIPRDIDANYFTWNDISFQLEHNYFYCNLPSFISSKRALENEGLPGGEKLMKDATEDRTVRNACMIVKEWELS